MFIGFLITVIVILVAIILTIKHLIKFTARTIYEEKARAEERHSQKIQNTSEPEEDR